MGTSLRRSRTGSVVVNGERGFPKLCVVPSDLCAFQALGFERGVVLKMHYFWHRALTVQPQGLSDPASFGGNPLFCLCEGTSHATSVWQGCRVSLGSPTRRQKMGKKGKALPGALTYSLYPPPSSPAVAASVHRACSTVSRPLRPKRGPSCRWHTRPHAAAPAPAAPLAYVPHRPAQCQTAARRRWSR